MDYRICLPVCTGSCMKMNISGFLLGLSYRVLLTILIYFLVQEFRMAWGLVSGLKVHETERSFYIASTNCRSKNLLKVIEG